MKIIKGFFCFLGVIFFLLISAGVYLWFVDPFEMRPMFDALMGDATIVSSIVGENVSDKATEDKHPVLNATQERALEVVGIDPAVLPTTITPAQEACFIEKLGEERVAEITAGESPNAVDVFTARSCVE